MTFLNPVLLWGLAAVSIPIIIHIFNLKRTKKIEFSTLMFLKEIQQSKYKRVKLKQLLILLCRIAFIIFLVLAFSRPFEKGYLFKGGSKARSSVLVIIDDSFSMLNREIQGSDLDAAKNRIDELLGVFDENDEVYFATVSSINQSGKNFLYKNITALRDSIKSVKVSDISRDFNSTIYYAAKILESSTNPNKEIFLFTDAQKTYFESESLSNTDVKLPESTRLNIILSGTRKGNNLAVDSVDVVTKIFEKNKPVRLRCTVSNHNTFNVSNKSVVMTLGKKPLREEKSVDIPANSSIDIEFSVVPSSTGFVSGSVELIEKEIADDEIPNDNRQYFAFYVPEKVRVLILSSGPQEPTYLKLALASSEELMRDSAGNKSNYYDIKQISSGELKGEDLSSYNCIISVDQPLFTDEASAKLKDYVLSGGGLIIYPGNETMITGYNLSLFKELDMPGIQSKYSGSEGSPVFKFEDVDLGHPIFDGMFTQRSGAKETLLRNSPELKTGFDILTGKDSRSIIKLSGGKNFLVEYSRGKGKVLLFGTSPDLNGSDYASKTVFSPITVRSVLYLSPVNSIHPASTGRDYFLDLTSIAKADTTPITINASFPGSPSQTLQVPDRNSIANMKDFLTVSSNYSLSQHNRIIYAFPSNYRLCESLLDKLNPKEITPLIKQRLGTVPNLILPENSVTEAANELRTGREIWQYLLVIALLMLAAEFLIARSIKT